MKKNKIFRRTLLIAACFAFISIQNVKAQTISDAFASLADTTGQSNAFTVLLSDSTGIAQIETKLGSNSGNDDLLFHVFDFDTQPSNPYSYQRTGNQLKLGIGNISKTDLYFGEVRIKYSNGTWSSPYSFISN